MEVNWFHPDSVRCFSCRIPSMTSKTGCWEELHEPGALGNCSPRCHAPCMSLFFLQGDFQNYFFSLEFWFSNSKHMTSRSVTSKQVSSSMSNVLSVWEPLPRRRWGSRQGVTHRHSSHLAHVISCTSCRAEIQAWLSPSPACCHPMAPGIPLIPVSTHAWQLPAGKVRSPVTSLPLANLGVRTGVMEVRMIPTSWAYCRD